MLLSAKRLFVSFALLVLMAVLGSSQNAWAYIYTLSGGGDTLTLKQYDEITGSYIKSLQKPQSVYATSIFAGPSNDLYTVTNPAGPEGAITRYNAINGDFIDNFTGPIWGPGANTLFGPDGNIYSRGNFSGYNLLTNTFSQYIHKLSGSTGQMLQQGFVTYSYSPGMAGLGSFAFGPDGNIYVGHDNQILRYSGLSGAFVDVFAQGITGDLTFGPDHNIYAFANDGIDRFDGLTGQSMGFFADAHGDQLRFGPDGNLYASNNATGVIAKYNGQTGTYLADVVTYSSGPLYFTFAGGHAAPEPVSSVLMLLGGGAMALRFARNNHGKKS